MLIDVPGVLTEFSKTGSGAFFIHFAGGDPALGMKVHNAAASDVIAVLSFGDRPHPSIKGPSIVGSSHFENRDVAVLRDAIVRPVYDLEALRDGSPRLDDHGAIIFVAGTALIRAYNKSGPMDVDLASGAAQSARSHPGAMWVDRWEIILPRPSGLTKLLEREI
jgi:hypothetical protein